MFRIWVAVIVIALFPFAVPAEEQVAEQHIEAQTEKEEQVFVTVTIEKSEEVRILILNVKDESKEGQQESKHVLSDDKEPAPNKKHSRRRGK